MVDRNGFNLNDAQPGAQVAPEVPCVRARTNVIIKDYR